MNNSKANYPAINSREENELDDRTLAHFNFLEQLVRVFEEQNFFYSVLGGFAVDSHLGELTRSHVDLYIAILAEDKPKLIGMFQDYFPDYKIYKNYQHKISFSKQGMLVDFLLLRDDDNKLKLDFSLDKEIPPQDRSVFTNSRRIGKLNLNTVNKDFLINLLQRFYKHRNKQKAFEDLEKLK